MVSMNAGVYNLPYFPPIVGGNFIKLGKFIQGKGREEEKKGKKRGKGREKRGGKREKRGRKEEKEERKGGREGNIHIWHMISAYDRQNLCFLCSKLAKCRGSLFKLGGGIYSRVRKIIHPWAQVIAEPMMVQQQTWHR